MDRIGTWIGESAAFSSSFGGSISRRQTDPVGLFVRADYARPVNIIEEMELALRLCGEDDDVGKALEMVVAEMFKGMRNLHEDENTAFMFDSLAEELNLDLLLREIGYTLKSVGQYYPVKVMNRVKVPNFKPGQNPVVAMPRLISLNPLSVRVLDVLGDGTPVLVQEVDEKTHEFLQAIGKDPEGGGGGGAQQELKRSDNPIAAALYTEPFRPELLGTATTEDEELLSGLSQAWYLNQGMISRYTLGMNTSISNYAPVPLRTVFGLCEAKRLINLMSYRLLNGAINFLIVVRKGSDQIPAVQEEIDNLQGIVAGASRTGVIVGDHRLEVDIIMPKMEAMEVAKEYQEAIGRRISESILRLPNIDFGRVEGGGTPQAQIASDVIESDRRIIKRWIERDIYQTMVDRNGSMFRTGRPKMWFPPVMIGGGRFFTDYVLKLRDRGDIPRSWAIEAAGYDASAALAERKRELASDFDEVMTAQNVPSTGDNPQNTGRPRSSDGGGTTPGNDQPDPLNNPNGGGNDGS